jgi:hypothetical protein
MKTYFALRNRWKANIGYSWQPQCKPAALCPRCAKSFISMERCK